MPPANSVVALIQISRKHRRIQRRNRLHTLVIHLFDVLPDGTRRGLIRSEVKPAAIVAKIAAQHKKGGRIVVKERGQQRAVASLGRTGQPPDHDGHKRHGALTTTQHMGQEGELHLNAVFGRVDLCAHPFELSRGHQRLANGTIHGEIAHGSGQYGRR